MPGAGALHVAVLGTGMAAATNGRILRSLGVACSFASRSPGRAERLARKVGGSGHFPSYEAALAAPGVDAVLVATPPSSHLDLARSALGAGKSVVVEKPPFLRSTDFDIVEEAARAAGRRVLVAENYHYKPLARTLRSLLARRVVGEIKFVSVNALKAQRSSGWRSDPALAGGGALYEGGIHWVSFVANLGPVVRSVRGFGASGGGADRGVLVVFEFEGGGVGTLSYSWEVPSALGGLRGSRIYGLEGTIAFESNGLGVVVWGREKGVLFPGVSDLLGRKAMWKDFLAALRGEREPEYDLVRARRDLALVERIYASLG